MHLRREADWILSLTRRLVVRSGQVFQGLEGLSGNHCDQLQHRPECNPCEETAVLDPETNKDKFVFVSSFVWIYIQWTTCGSIDACKHSFLPVVSFFANDRGISKHIDLFSREFWILRHPAVLMELLINGLPAGPCPSGALVVCVQAFCSL